MRVIPGLILFASLGWLGSCAPAAGPGGIILDSPRILDQVQMTNTVVLAHNEARAAVGVRALTIDPALTVQALAYANELAGTGRWEHSSNESRPGQGENLWRGTVGRYSYAQMVAPWIDERRFFRPGTFPGVSTTGRSADVGHYTQAVWRDSTRIGCGVASGLGRDVLVCRYSPPGNVRGERVY